MKKITILALFLGMLSLFALSGCTAEKNDLPGNGQETETENPSADNVDENNNSIETGMIERMKNLTESDILYISSQFEHVTARQLAGTLNDAAEHQMENDPEYFYIFYDLTAYLSQMGEGYSSDDEQLTLFAGLEENLVEILYNDGNEGHEKGFFKDSALYWLLRNNYHSEGTIETGYYEQYRDIIEARAQQDLQNAFTTDRTPAFTGYEITDFKPVDVFETDGGTYETYLWRVVFFPDIQDKFDVEKIPLAGGMYLDSEGRVCGYDEEIYLAIKKTPGADDEYRFLSWESYLPDEDSEAGKANALEAINAAFANN